MHDITDLERRRIPRVFVASRVFRDASRIQADALGFTPRSVFVDHPIQDRTDPEIAEMARLACDEIVAAIVSPSPPS